MYPSLLRDMTFPVAKAHTFATMNPTLLIDHARHGGVIARVRVRSEVPEYPVRRDERTIYPVGEYWATLAGPDIAALAEDSEIVECRDVVTYYMGRPFKTAMDTLLSERADAKARGDEDAQAFAKLCANSLAGRCAMRQGGWVRDSRMDCPGKWGEESVMNATSQTVTKYRYLCGAAWRYDAESAPQGPHTSCFAYLTAYGRQLMRQLRKLCSDLSVVSQDTDGLYLLPTGLDQLRRAGKVGDGRPGQLRLVGSERSAQFFSPKHYRYGDAWVLAGLAYTGIDAQYMTVTYTQRTPLIAQKLRERPDIAGRVVRTIPIPRELDAGSVDPDGWIRPQRLSLDSSR